MATILVVDDDTDIREVIGQYFEQRAGDHQVFMAQDGVEALEILQREHVDLALIDLHMPRMSGIELVDRCNRLFPDVRYVVMSGHEDAIALARQKLMFQPVLLHKPFELKQLDGIVAGALQDEFDG